MSAHQRPCGERFRRIAESLFDRGTFERVIHPAIADLRHECSASPQALVRIRAWWGIARVSALCLTGDVLRDRDRAFRGLARRTALVLPVLAALLMLPLVSVVLSYCSKFGFVTGAVAGALLTPPHMLLSLPPAFFLAICLHRSPPDSRTLRFVPSTMAAAFVCAAILFAMIMTIVPAANEMARTHLANAIRRADPGVHVDLRPGLAEMSLRDLNDHIRHAPSPRAASIARAHRSDRVALVASVIVVAILGLGVAGRWRPYHVTTIVAVGMLVLYGGAFSVGAGMLKRTTAFGYETWLVNVVFAAIGLRLVASRARALSMEPGR